MEKQRMMKSEHHDYINSEEKFTFWRPQLDFCEGRNRCEVCGLLRHTGRKSEIPDDQVPAGGGVPGTVQRIYRR